MSEEPSSPPPRQTDDGTTISIIILVLLVALAIYYVPRFLFQPRLAHIPMSPEVQMARTINLMMFQYANDNGNAYPTGKSSTEVFQKLIDGGYCSDPAIFYFAMPGKIKATSNKLKPENVCWDVTISVKSDDPDELPLVFSTGYRISYMSNGKAVPLKASSMTVSGIFVAYKNNSARFMKDDALPDHIVTNFINPGFNPKGKTYQQLTPDGPLAP